MNEYWGEIPPMPEVGPGIVAVERAEMTRVGPISVRSNHLNYRLSHCQNSCEDRQTVVTIDGSDGNDISDVPIGSPVMLHSIKLLQILRQLNDNTDKNELTRDSIPQLIESEDKPILGLNVLKIKGKNLNERAVKELVRRAVIIITSFHGFDYMNESVIDLLVDLLSEYLIHLCRTLRTTTDSSELRSSNDFIDVIDRVFHDMNVSDFESLRQYDSDIRLYNQNLTKEVHKKVGINESLNNGSKISPNMPLICETNSHNSPQLPDTKEVEQTLSLNSLLSSYKVSSDEIQESEHFFGLTSPQSNSLQKTTDN